MPRTTAVEPPGCPAQLRALCGDELGVVKVVQARERRHLSLVARWGDGEPSRVKEIVAMSLADDSLAVARKSGVIDVLDVKDGKRKCQLVVPKTEAAEKRQGRDRICGVHLFQGATNVLGCKEDGTAVIVHESKEAPVVANWSFCSPAGKVLTMKVHQLEKFAAVGGDGVELNIWDLEKQCKTWEAKKPKPDKLGLMPPAFVTSSAFLTKDDHRKIVIGTGTSTVRLYDVVAQRREILSFTYGESAIRAVAEDPDGFSVYVGNAVGHLATFDIRTGRQIGVFKGKMAGSVRCIARHQTLPLIASCGLDRFLRVHDTKKRQLLSRIFLKVPLVGVIFDERTSPEIAGPDDDDGNKRKRDDESESNADDESDKDDSSEDEDNSSESIQEEEEEEAPITKEKNKKNRS